MKSVSALLLWLVLALAPQGAQAHAGTAHCGDHPAQTASAGQASIHTQALHTVAMLHATGTDAQPCPHRHDGPNSCHCLHACSGAAAVIAVSPPALRTLRREEAPAGSVRLATHDAPPLDLLRPPTTTL